MKIDIEKELTDRVVREVMAELKINPAQIAEQLNGKIKVSIPASLGKTVSEKITAVLQKEIEDGCFNEQLYDAMMDDGILYELAIEAGKQLLNTIKK